MLASCTGVAAAFAESGRPSRKLANEFPDGAGGRRVGGFGAGEDVGAVRARQVVGDGLQAPHIPAHLEFVPALDPGQTLVELVRVVVLPAVVHFALLHAPGGVSVGSGELDHGRRVGIAGESGESDLRGEPALRRHDTRPGPFASIRRCVCSSTVGEKL